MKIAEFHEILHASSTAVPYVRGVKVPCVFFCQTSYPILPFGGHFPDICSSLSCQEPSVDKGIKRKHIWQSGSMLSVMWGGWVNSHMSRRVGCVRCTRISFSIHVLYICENLLTLLRNRGEIRTYMQSTSRTRISRQYSVRGFQIPR